MLYGQVQVRVRTCLAALSSHVRIGWPVDSTSHVLHKKACAGILAQRVGAYEVLLAVSHIPLSRSGVLRALLRLLCIFGLVSGLLWRLRGLHLMLRMHIIILQCISSGFGIFCGQELFKVAKHLLGRWPMLRAGRLLASASQALALQVGELLL